MTVAQWSLVRKTAKWFGLNVLLAQGIPIAYTLVRGQAAFQKYMGNATMPLIAFGIYLATVADAWIDRVHPTFMGWWGFLLAGMMALGMCLVAIELEYAPGNQVTPVIFVLNLWPSVVLMIACTVVKAGMMARPPGGSTL